MNSTHKIILPALFFLFSIVIQAQVTVQVKINSGSSTTTCTDGPFGGGPEERFKIQVAGQGYTYYGDSGACFGTLPNTQYNEIFNCASSLPTNLQICLGAFEDDGSACTFSESCPELRCENFPIPAIGSSAIHNLNVVGASEALINFTITVTGTFPPGAVYDTACSAVNLGILTPNGTLGNSTLSNYGNFCANDVGDPEPWGGNNEQGVWFKFITSASATNIVSIDAKSDPQSFGNDIDLQLSLYQSNSGNCMSGLTAIEESYGGLGLINNEAINAICLTANTTYYLLVDGENTAVVNTDGVEGFFGLQINDNTIDNTISISGDTLTANASGYSYQWVDCNDSNAPISGETNQSFTINTTGSYAVEIDNGNCVTISNCENMIPLHQNTFSLAEKIKLYPNPTKGSISINLNAVVSKLTTQIYSITGQLLQHIESENISQFDFDLPRANGLYFIEVVTPDSKKTFKVLKNN